MNNNIKEILDKIEKVANRETASRNALMEMKDKDYQLLLDYITNLQERINNYENPEDLTLFYMWLDEKAKDKLKGLQQRIDKLNNRIHALEKHNQKLQLEAQKYFDLLVECEHGSKDE